MAKKTAAQIRRLQKRAADRGEAYKIPEENADDDKKKDETIIPNKNKNISKEKTSQNKQKINIATKLHNELETIMDDKEIKAKERRSHKRKAEAIALEESGCSTIDELLNFLPKNKKKKNNEDGTNDNTGDDVNKSQSKDEKEASKYPLILFIGQLSYDTTKEQISEYFYKKLKQDPSISSTMSSPNDINASALFQVRLLTDSKTKKSKGMAFFQTYDPQIMYACLQLHHTYLNGRRINVEKSTGGKKDSKIRQDKLSSFRTEQKKYLSNSVDSMFKEFVDNGTIDKKEFDDNTIGVCKRHAPSIVHKTLLEYIETKEHKKFAIRNKSSYFIAMLEKVGKDDNNDDEKHRDEKKYKPVFNRKP